MNRPGPIILLAGLPLEEKTSFSRQLDSLASLWLREGRSVFLCGPVFSDSGTGPLGGKRGFAAPDPLWRLRGLREDHLHFEDLLKRTGARALVALGYPDQFPFLQEKAYIRPPCFLWSQFSRPPRGDPPGAPTWIPLTGKTEAFLREAGCSRIGPIVPHGVDTELFAPVHQPDRGKRGHGYAGPLIVGTVGNNSRRKRFDLILRSFALLVRELPNSRLLIKTNRLVSLDGTDLPALVARENLRDRIEIIVEDLTDRQMAELYNRMDLYINLSEWEGFCIPVIEAMACGVPVVCPPIQGPGEILPYGDTLVRDNRLREEEGTVLYEAKPRGVSRLLLEVAGRIEMRARLSREGREKALSGYDLRRVAALWDALLSPFA